MVPECLRFLAPGAHDHVQRAEDFCWTGDYIQSIATVALAASKGIVVIETSLIRSDDARVRGVFEKEFGRSDLKYLIKTHHHHDHTAGNQVYADATIIGHKNVPAGRKMTGTSTRSWNTGAGSSIAGGRSSASTWPTRT